MRYDKYFVRRALFHTHTRSTRTLAARKQSPAVRRKLMRVRQFIHTHVCAALRVRERVSVLKTSALGDHILYCPVDAGYIEHCFALSCVGVCVSGST